VIVRNSANRKKKQSLCLLVGAFLFLMLIGCAQNPVSGEHDFVMLSEDSEIAIGRTNHPKIIKQYGRYKDEALQAYVQVVGNRLANVSHREGLIYRFTVLDSSTINAFALPGGYIYITRGLMAYLNSEAELAAVLGHEIGHVTARHGVRQQSAAQVTNLGYLVGSIFFPELRAAPSRQLFNIFGGALLSGYGREHELESDGLGAEYLARAGYDPKAMIDVIRVLKDQEMFSAAQAKKQGLESKGYHGLFASHPDNDIRLQEVIDSAKKFSKGQKGKILRATYLNKINGMTFGDSEEQGIRSGRHFYHSVMKFAVDFPMAWQINNRADSLQAISAGGKAFIEMRAMDLNRRLSPQEFIKQRLNVSSLKAGVKLSVDGLKGYTGLFESKGKPVRIAVIYLRDQAFVFFASVKENKTFNQFDHNFLATINSLHRLRQNEFDLAKELKVEVLSVNKHDSYINWAKESRISNSPLMALRLLNGHYPNGKLHIRQLAKRIK
jgi:predicted Zn-dependent protease